MGIFIDFSTHILFSCLHVQFTFIYCIFIISQPKQGRILTHEHFGCKADEHLVHMRGFDTNAQRYSLNIKQSYENKIVYYRFIGKVLLSLVFSINGMTKDCYIWRAAYKYCYIWRAAYKDCYIWLAT